MFVGVRYLSEKPEDLDWALPYLCAAGWVTYLQVRVSRTAGLARLVGRLPRPSLSPQQQPQQRQQTSN